MCRFCGAGAGSRSTTRSCRPPPQIVLLGEQVTVHLRRRRTSRRGKRRSSVHLASQRAPCRGREERRGRPAPGRGRTGRRVGATARAGGAAGGEPGAAPPAQQIMMNQVAVNASRGVVTHAPQPNAIIRTPPPMRQCSRMLSPPPPPQASQYAYVHMQTAFTASCPDGRNRPATAHPFRHCRPRNGRGVLRQTWWVVWASSSSTMLPRTSTCPPPPPGVGGAGSFARGSLALLAQEQEGSRLLQQQLVSMPPGELIQAVDELGPHLANLATNAFGNYLVSAMTSLHAAHPAIHSALTGNVCRLMQHPQGSRVVQAALERLPAHLSATLVDELEGRVSEVASGTHGSWSVVAAYKHTHKAFVLKELAHEIRWLSAQQNGSRVVQRVLAEAAQTGGDLTSPVEQLLNLGQTLLIHLAEDRFGNYVIQLALRHAPMHLKAQLLDILLPGFAALAVGKCGSNVAEVLVELASPMQVNAVRAALGVQAETLRAHVYGSYAMNALDARRV